MRNPERLNSLYGTLHAIHRDMFPDWRFGQLMSNFLGWCVSEEKCTDIFFPEDAKWEKWIKEYAESMGYKPKDVPQVEPDENNERYRLTPATILIMTLADYGIKNDLPSKIADHMYEDFMHALEKSGYVEKQ